VQVNDSALKSAAKTFGASLQSLSLSAGKNLTPKGIHALLQACPNLQKLELSHYVFGYGAFKNAAGIPASD